MIDALEFNAATLTERDTLFLIQFTTSFRCLKIVQVVPFEAHNRLGTIIGRHMG